jgi:hypothetical protein
MLRRVALVRTDVSEEHNASIIRVTRIGELGILAVTSARHNIPQDGILHSHRHENFKSYIIFRRFTFCVQKLSCRTRLITGKILAKIGITVISRLIFIYEIRTR